MHFLTFSKVKVNIAKKKLFSKSYTIAKALFTTKRVQIISPNRFIKAVLDLKKESFIVYITRFFITLIEVHSDRKIQIAAFNTNKAFVIVLAEYSDFKDVFSKKSFTVLPAYTEINTYVINLEEDRLPPYGPIYSLKLMKLETLKIYIKTNLANSFIRLSKSSVDVPILFEKNSDGSLWICVDYRDLNNITIKNWYLFSLVSKSLDCLGRAKQFI